MDRPEEPEEVFCTFSMARMLAEALPHVNPSKSSAVGYFGPDQPRNIARRVADWCHATVADNCSIHCRCNYGASVRCLCEFCHRTRYVFDNHGNNHCRYHLPIHPYRLFVGFVGLVASSHLECGSLWWAGVLDCPVATCVQAGASDFKVARYRKFPNKRVACRLR